MRELGFRPSKALGQHFLHDRKIVQRIVAASGIGPESTVLEIGPGLGILTSELADRAATVIAVEMDPDLARSLRSLVPANVQIHQSDALHIEPGAIAGHDYAVVANLPYSAATAILRHLLESNPPPTSLTVMVQREVADRIVACPPRMSLLSVSVQFYGVPRTLFRIGKGAFIPPPTVESAVVRIDTRSPLLPPEARQAFFRLVRAGFGQRRKQIANSIAAGLELPRAQVASLIGAAGLQPSARAEQLSVDDWVRLYQAFSTIPDRR